MFRGYSGTWVMPNRNIDGRDTAEFGAGCKWCEGRGENWIGKDHDGGECYLSWISRSERRETLMRCPSSFTLAGLSRCKEMRACRSTPSQGCWLEIWKDVDTTRRCRYANDVTATAGNARQARKGTNQKRQSRRSCWTAGRRLHGMEFHVDALK
jgi:hypothetical protein